MSPRGKNNSERINVFFSPDVVQELKLIAGKKGTTVSGLVRMIVHSYLDEQHAKNVFEFIANAPKGTYDPYE